jgi:hypothetical protein
MHVKEKWGKEKRGETANQTVHETQHPNLAKIGNGREKHT